MDLNEADDFNSDNNAYESHEYWDASSDVIPWCIREAAPTDIEYRVFFMYAEFISGVVVIPAICIPGLIGNVLSAVVMAQRKMRTTTNAFLTALVTSDSIQLLLGVLYFALVIVKASSRQLGLFIEMETANLDRYFTYVSLSVSSWIVVAVAIERYIVITHPVLARNKWTRKKAIRVSAVIYSVMSVLALPHFLYSKVITCRDSGSNLTKHALIRSDLWQHYYFSRMYTWTHVSIRSIIPLCALVVVNISIILSIRRNENLKIIHFRATVMLTAIVISYVICIVPDTILAVMEIWSDISYLTKGFKEITDSLMVLNAGLDFLIYFVFNPFFRNHFISIFFPLTEMVRNLTQDTESTARSKSFPISTDTLSEQQCSLAVLSTGTIPESTLLHTNKTPSSKGVTSEKSLQHIVSAISGLSDAFALSTLPVDPDVVLPLAPLSAAATSTGSQAVNISTLAVASTSSKSIVESKV